MILCDVNILVYAFRGDMPDHARFREWLRAGLSGPQQFAASELVLSSFVRIVTNPKAFERPDATAAALEFAGVVRERPNCTVVAPGPRHWEIFTRLCRTAGAKGDLVSDAYLAALAVETGSELITVDRDFARFPGLRWRHPLRASSA